MYFLHHMLLGNNKQMSLVVYITVIISGEVLRVQDACYVCSVFVTDYKV